MDEDDKTKIETRSRIVILDTEDVSELFKKKQDMRMSEDDAYRSVGASISVAIGQSIDVTRSEKGYADLLKSVREECEQGLSVALDFDNKNNNKNKNEHLQMCLNVTDAENEDRGMDDNEKEKEDDKKKEKEDKEKENEDEKQKKENDEEDENFFWSYLLTPRDTVLSTISKKCSAIANITILFRGRADEGILTIVDSAYLTFNERVIDIASIAPNQDDRRVATFRGFPETQPFLFSCMSEKDELKIFIRFKKCPKAFGKEMVRILADLFCFDTQDDFLHQSWILPLKFDEGQELFYDCSKTPATLTTRGGLGAPPDVLARRASRGWPHSMEFESEESDSDASKSQNSHESEKSSSSTRRKNEMRMRMEWQRRLEADAMEKRAKERAKTAIASMTGTLHLRGRAYSDEDVFHIQRLFGASSGMSPEGEALCAIEIARWKAQKQLLEDELAVLNKEIGKKDKEKEEEDREEKEKEKEKEIEEENDKNVHVMPI